MMGGNKIQMHAIGAGGYGQVRAVDANTVQKRFYNSYKEQGLRRRQTLLNAIDPSREYFGAKILGYVRTNKIRMVNEGHSLDKIFFTRRCNLQYFQLLLLNIEHLLRGLMLFHDHGLIHGDIKLENVVLNESLGICKYIDYDFMGSIDEYRAADDQNLLFPKRAKRKTYFVWPPERYTIAKRFHDIVVDDYTAEVWNELGLVSTLGHDSRIVTSLFKSEAIDPTLKPESDWVKQLVTAHAHHDLRSDAFSKIDIYGFGIMVSQVLRQFEHWILPSMRRPIKRWLSFLVHPNPSVRYAPKYALEIWERIFSSMSIPPFFSIITDLETLARRYPTVTFYQLVSYVYRYYGLDTGRLQTIITHELRLSRFRPLLSDMVFVTNQIPDASIRDPLLIAIFQKYERTIAPLQQTHLNRIIRDDLHISSVLDSLPIRAAFSRRRK